MLVTCCRMDGMIYNNGEEKINHSNYSSKKQKCGTHCNTSDTVSALPSPVTSRRIRSFGHTKWMFPSKLNVSLKSFDFDEHFKKVSEKFLATVHYSVSLPPLMQYCETCLWMPLHSNKGLSETKFSSCSLIFFLKQKIRCWTLPNSVLCIWQASQRKLKDNSAFSLSLDRDAYGLYDPLGRRILQNLDLEGIF